VDHWWLSVVTTDKTDGSSINRRRNAPIFDGHHQWNISVHRWDNV